MSKMKNYYFKSIDSKATEFHQRINDLMDVMDEIFKEYEILDKLIPDLPENKQAKDYIEKIIRRRVQK